MPSIPSAQDHAFISIPLNPSKWDKEAVCLRRIEPHGIACLAERTYSFNFFFHDSSNLTNNMFQIVNLSRKRNLSDEKLKHKVLKAKKK